MQYPNFAELKYYALNIQNYSMKKLLLFLTTMLVAVCMANASQMESRPSSIPTDANIYGHVVDAKTGEHIPGITITIKGTTLGTMTGSSGHYFFTNLKPGKVTLVMRGVGYTTQQKTVVVDANKSVEVNFEAQEDEFNLDEVVVSANREQTIRRFAPTLVNVLDNKIFINANAHNLAQGLVFQPGVRVENDCQNCGFNQVRINGLDGHFTQVLIDSRPVMSSLAGVYGLEQIPANMIERVEVVRGGGSALYGSSAIAGVINVITKEPNQNSVSFSESMGFTGFKNLDNNLGFNASLVSDNARAGAMIFGQARYRDAWDENGDGYSEIGRINARSLGARAYLKTGDYSKITAEMHSIQEDRRGGDHLDWPDHVAGVSEHVNHSIYSGNLKYDLFSEGYKHHFQTYLSAQDIRRNSYYGGIGEIEVNGKVAGQVGVPVPKEEYGDDYGFTHGFTANAGMQYSYNADNFLFMPAQLLLGVEYTYDRLTDIMPIRNWKANDKGESLYPKMDQIIHNPSQFGQIEWKDDMFSILLGARLDENSALKKPIVSPRATLRYNPTEDINIRASYAKGFRAPQVFDEDLHVAVVQGESKKVINDENLKPEVSHAFSLSADMYQRFGDVQTNFMIEGFYTRIKDVFTTQEISSNDGFFIEKRLNGAGAYVYGVNLEGKLAYRWFKIQAGLTFSKNRYDEPQEWGLNTVRMNGAFVKEKNEEGNMVYKNESMTSNLYTRTPSVYGYYTIGFNPVKPLNIAITGSYTGRMHVPHVIGFGQHTAVSDVNIVPEVDDNDAAPRVDELLHSKAFFEMGAKLSYDFKLYHSINLQLFAGVTNIFNAFQRDYDKGPDRDSGFIYGPTQPRTGYMGLKFDF